MKKNIQERKQITIIEAAAAWNNPYVRTPREVRLMKDGCVNDYGLTGAWEFWQYVDFIRSHADEYLRHYNIKVNFTADDEREAKRRIEERSVRYIKWTPL